MEFKVWRSAKNKEWYWTLIAGNGEKIAASGEGYKNKADCLHILARIKDGAAAAPVEELAAPPAKPKKAAKAKKPGKAKPAAKPEAKTKAKAKPAAKAPAKPKAAAPKAAAKPKAPAKPRAAKPKAAPAAG